jgi:putative hydrolase of the HAD superfamily
VFVDDLPHNVAGAVAVGMVGVHHEDPRRTVGELEAVLGVSLSFDTP